MSVDKNRFQIGDLIIPNPPLKQIPGLVLLAIDIDDSRQDLKIALSDDGKIVWVSSLDVKILKYKKIPTFKLDPE